MGFYTGIGILFRQAVWLWRHGSYAHKTLRAYRQSLQYNGQRRSFNRKPSAIDSFLYEVAVALEDMLQGGKFQNDSVDNPTTPSGPSKPGQDYKAWVSEEYNGLVMRCVQLFYEGMTNSGILLNWGLDADGQQSNTPLWFAHNAHVHYEEKQLSVNYVIATDIVIRFFIEPSLFGLDTNLLQEAGNANDLPILRITPVIFNGSKKPLYDITIADRAIYYNLRKEDPPHLYARRGDGRYMDHVAWTDQFSDICLAAQSIYIFNLRSS